MCPVIQVKVMSSTVHSNYALSSSIKSLFLRYFKGNLLRVFPRCTLCGLRSGSSLLLALALLAALLAKLLTTLLAALLATLLASLLTTLLATPPATLLARLLVTLLAGDAAGGTAGVAAGVTAGVVARNTGVAAGAGAGCSPIFPAALRRVRAGLFCGLPGYLERQSRLAHATHGRDQCDFRHHYSGCASTDRNRQLAGLGAGVHLRFDRNNQHRRRVHGDPADVGHVPEILSVEWRL